LLVTCLALDAAVLAWFVLSPRSETLIWSLSVQEALERGQHAEWLERRVRVTGTIVPETVDPADPCRLSFQLRDHTGAALAVRRVKCFEPFPFCLAFGAYPPGTSFEGRLAREHGRLVLEAERATMSCPGKYDTSAQAFTWLAQACTNQPENLRRLCPWCHYAERINER